MTAPYVVPDSLDEAVTEHLAVIAEVRKLGSDIVQLRGGMAQVQADVLRAVDAATVASGKCDLVLRRLAELSADIRRLVGSNGHG